MKKKLLVLFYGISLVVGQKIDAAEFGKAIMGGSGCPKVEIPQIIEGENILPLKINVEKTAEQQFARAACSVRVPVKLKKNEMLKIVSGGLDYEVEFDKSGAGGINLYANLGAKNDMSSGGMLAGSDRSSLKIPKAESPCGKDTMLKINLNANVTGKSKSSIKTQDLKFEIRSSKCN